jgi:SAM-dependent methyltransferase
VGGAPHPPPLPPMPPRPDTPAEFDAWARDYEVALQRGLSVSGEGSDYFARGRVAWVQRRLRELGAPPPATVLDHGCGIGSQTALLRDELGAKLVVGIDPSAESLRVARHRRGSDRLRFEVTADFRPGGDVDLAYCNGVFHHIPPDERPAAVDLVRRALRPGGLFAFWENNPWNPGTRWVMSRIPFDRDAITLSALEARRLLREGGLDVLGVDFQFVFPRALAPLRAVEPWLAKLPLGAQYLALALRPR